MSTDVSMKQPKQLYMLFFAEMWERFSFYGMRALLILYMTRGVLDYKDETAFGVYAAYGALVYATPFFGGILAERFLGYRKSVMLGAILMAIGHFVMAIETSAFFYGALAFLIIGNGFFKPNVSSIVGNLYGEGDPRRDSGFTIFYMGINLGAFLAPLICGIVGEVVGWHYGFGLAGVGMLLGLIVFWKGQGSLGENGAPKDPEYLKGKTPVGLSREHLIYTLSFLIVPLIAATVWYNAELTTNDESIFGFSLMDLILVPFGIAILVWLLYQAFTSDKVTGQRLGVIIILVFFTMVFWAFFEQAGSSITLFTDRNVDRTIFGWEIPASIFQSVNPLFIVALGPIFSSLWISLRRKEKEPSTPLKFTLGVLQLGLGFFALYLGCASADENGMVSVLFLLLGYLLHTTGELSLSPVGLSMVTKLAPAKIVAMIMGAWFLSSTFAHYIGGSIANYTSTSKYMESALMIESTRFAEGTHQDKETTAVTFRVYDTHENGEKDEKGNAKHDTTYSDNVVLNITLDKSLEEADKPNLRRADFNRYASLKPGASDTMNLRVTHLDPNGDLMDVELVSAPVNGEIVEMGDTVIFKAAEGFVGTAVLEYKMCNKKDASKCQSLKVHYTVDDNEHHAPVAIASNIDITVPFSSTISKSEVLYNVLDNFYDKDGESLSIDIVEHADADVAKKSDRRAFVKVKSSLNSFVDSTKTLHIYGKVFLVIAIACAIATVVLLGLVPILRKWMHGIH